jgi:hypothetical protein
MRCRLLASIVAKLGKNEHSWRASISALHSGCHKDVPTGSFFYLTTQIDSQTSVPPVQNMPGFHSLFLPKSHNLIIALLPPLRPLIQTTKSTWFIRSSPRDFYFLPPMILIWMHSLFCLHLTSQVLTCRMNLTPLYHVISNASSSGSKFNE